MEKYRHVRLQTVFFLAHSYSRSLFRDSYKNFEAIYFAHFFDKKAVYKTARYRLVDFLREKVICPSFNQFRNCVLVSLTLCLYHDFTNFCRDFGYFLITNYAKRRYLV